MRLALSHTHYWYELGMLKIPAYVCMYVCIFVCMYVYASRHLSPSRGPLSCAPFAVVDSAAQVPIDTGSSPEVDFSEAGIMLPRRKGDGRSSAVGRIIQIKSQDIIRIRTSSSKEDQRAVCSSPQLYPTLRKITEIMHHTA